MRDKPSLVFCIVLIAVFAVALVSAQSFRAQARLFPIVIAIVGLVLAFFQLGMEAKRQKASIASIEPAGTTEELGSAESLTPGETRRRMIMILAWIVAFAVSVWLLGFPLAVPLLTLAYLRFDARESWITSVVFAATSGIVFYGLFVYAVRIPFDDGFVFTLFSS